MWEASKCILFHRPVWLGPGEGRCFGLFFIFIFFLVRCLLWGGRSFNYIVFPSIPFSQLNFFLFCPHFLLSLLWFFGGCEVHELVPSLVGAFSTQVACVLSVLAIYVLVGMTAFLDLSPGENLSGDEANHLAVLFLKRLKVHLHRGTEGGFARPTAVIEWF